jgi:hypothetical protein
MIKVNCSKIQLKNEKLVNINNIIVYIFKVAVANCGSYFFMYA